MQNLGILKQNINAIQGNISVTSFRIKLKSIIVKYQSNYVSFGVRIKLLSAARNAKLLFRSFQWIHEWFDIQSL